MLARAFPQRDYVIVALPPMQFRSRYAEVFFQIGGSCNLARPVFNAKAVASLISRS